MDLLILDKNFDTIGIIDTYESFNWTDRYNEAGDFEITMVLDTVQHTKELLSIFVEDNYVYLGMSEHLMIIEDLNITTDQEEGNKLVVSGRSLESILDRRIVWDQVVYPVNAYICR